MRKAGKQAADKKVLAQVKQSVCTCVQAAFVRNVKGWHFPERMKDGDRERLGARLVEQVRRTVPDFEDVRDLEDMEDWEVVAEMAHLTPVESRRAGYHLLYLPRRIGGLYCFCEVMSANHLTFTVVGRFLAVDEALLLQVVAELQQIVDAVGNEVDFAWSERLGFQTTQLSLVGTGFRLRTWMHLAGLIHFGHLHELYNAVTFRELDLDVEGIGPNTPVQMPMIVPGNIYILFNRKTLGQSVEACTRDFCAALAMIVEQEQLARRRLKFDEPFILLDIVRRMAAALDAGLMMGAEEARDCLSDFYLAWSIDAISPRITQEAVPTAEEAMSMTADELFCRAFLPKVLLSHNFPPAVESFEPWARDAARIVWIRESFGFSIGKNLERRAAR